MPSTKPVRACHNSEYRCPFCDTKVWGVETPLFDTTQSRHTISYVTFACATCQPKVEVHHAH